MVIGRRFIAGKFELLIRFQCIQSASSMPVDLWKFESRLYADIDACGARGKPILKKEYSLGSCQKVNIYIRLKTGNAISNQLAVLPREIKFIVNFRRNS